MKKRIRKKMKRGEYAEFGFEAEFVDPAVIGYGEFNEPLFDKIIEFSEALGLNAGGCVGPKWDLYVSACHCKVCKPLRDGRKGCDERDRTAFAEFLAALPVENIVIGPLKDVLE